MRPLTEDRKALVAILESGEYETAEDLAEAVWSHCSEAIKRRDTYGVRVSVGPTLHLAFGPFDTKATAGKYAKQLAGASVHPLLGPAVLIGHLEERSESRYCAECSHAVFAHLHSGEPGCLVGGCRCKRYITRGKLSA